MKVAVRDLLSIVEVKRAEIGLGDEVKKTTAIKVAAAFTHVKKRAHESIVDVEVCCFCPPPVPTDKPSQTNINS